MQIAKLVILLISLCFISCDDSKYDKLVNLTDHTFDNEISTLSKEDTKWFVIFYVDTCNYCKNALETLKEDVIPLYENNDNVRFGAINANQNVWMSIRFNITYIPYMIMIEKGKMYEFKSHFSPDSFEQFINEEKNAEDAKPIPEKNTYFFMLKTVMRESFIMIKMNLESFLKKHGYDVKINDYMMGGIIAVSLISMILMENWLLKFICGGKKKVAKKGEEKKEEAKKEKNEQPKKEEKKKKKE